MSLVRRYAAITAVLTVLMMTVLDVTLVNVALPVLADHFGVSDSASVWLVTVYQLIITMILLPASAVGDIFSYRKVFLFGVTVFTLGSAACAISTGFTMLVVSRGIQGIGAGCVMGVNIALTRMIYPPEVLGRGLALNAMVIAVATAAGPSIAGAMLSIVPWHWLFVINIPFGLIAIVLGYRLLPENKTASRQRKFDFIGCLENALTFGLVLFALGNISRKGDLWTSAALLTLGLAFGFIYIRRERGKPDPMLPVDLFHIRLYTLSIFTSLCSFMGQNLAMISLPFLFHNAYGFPASVTGLLMTPWPVMTMIVSPMAARYVERHEPAAVAAFGMLVCMLGLGSLLALPTGEVSAWNVAWRMAVCGIGYGMYQTPNNIVMVKATPMRRSGAAGGMQGTARLTGQTLGATAVTLIFTLLSGTRPAVSVCLMAGMFFCAVASLFSLSRTSKKVVADS